MSLGRCTGEKRSQACERCGQTVIAERHEAFIHGRVESWWAPDEHAGPCGLACMGGSVSGPALKTRRFHRSALDCPTCRPKAKA